MEWGRKAVAKKRESVREVGTGAAAGGGPFGYLWWLVGGSWSMTEDSPYFLMR